MDKRGYASAGKGLAITLMALGSAALLQIALAHQIVSIGLHEPAYAWEYTPAYRHMVLNLHTVAGLFALAYWLAMAIFCRGDMLKVRSANACLLVSFLLLEAPMILNSAPAISRRTLDRLCAALGVREPSQVTYGFDPISNCDLFLDAWGRPAFLGLLAALFLASGALRIFVARYRSHAQAAVSDRA